MAITQEMKNVVRDIKIETISDFGTFQELESFAKELLNSNDTGNKLLALRIQNRLNENPNYQTFVNRQQIEEAQAVEQKEKEVDKTQHLRQQNATANVENRKRTENNEKSREAERKLIESVNYKNAQSMKLFLEQEFKNLSLDGSIEFLENVNKSLREEKDPKKREEIAFEITDAGSANSKYFDKMNDKIIPYGNDSPEVLDKKIKLIEESNSIANFASPHPKTSPEFVKDMLESFDVEAALKTWKNIENIEGYKSEYKDFLFINDASKIIIKPDAPSEIKEWYHNKLLIEKEKQYYECVQRNKEDLIANGHSPNSIVANEIEKSVQSKVEKIVELFKEENNSKQFELNNGEQIKNILYTVQGLDSETKTKVLQEVFEKLGQDKNYQKLMNYHKTEINQMLLSHDDNIDSVAKDDFIRHLYETENHYALRAFLETHKKEFGNPKSIDIIIEKLGEQYQRIDRIEEKAKAYLDGKNINNIDLENIKDSEVKRYIELEQSINDKSINSLNFNNHLILTQSLATTYNKYFENNNDVENYIQNAKNNSSFFNEQELRQLQDLSRGEFYIVLRNLVIEKMKEDPVFNRNHSNIDTINEYKITKYLIEHDKNFANSEYGRNFIQNEKNKEIEIKNDNQINTYNPTVRGQGQTEGVAYEAQVLVEKNYKIMPHDTQVFIPNGNSGLI